MIEVRQVRSVRERRRFLTFPWSIYRHDPIWVPPLLPDLMRTTDPRRGLFFRRGTADFFTAFADGRPVGTICAAEDPPTNEARGGRDCVVGFFECIDDHEVAGALFDRAAEWAASRGLTALFGPFNLDYENAYGVLLEGRDRPPALFCGHTPPYYHRLFDSYGFMKARGDNIALAAGLDASLPGIRRLSRLAGIARKRSGLTVRSADLRAFDREVDIIHGLLVRSLAHLPDAVPWRRDVLKEMLGPLVKLADPELVLFVCDGDRDVGWFPGLPNFNERTIGLNGLRHPWDYLRIPSAMRRRPACLTVKSVLVLPEYWNRGAAALLFAEMAERARAKGYSWVDLSLTAEDNPQTPLIAESAGATVYKRYRTYRKTL